MEKCEKKRKGIKKLKKNIYEGKFKDDAKW